MDGPRRRGAGFDPLIPARTSSPLERAGAGIDHGQQFDRFTGLASSAGKVILELAHEAYPNAKLEVVALGCLGMHACLLEFARSRCRHALVILLEHPMQLQQKGLNALGIGPHQLRAVSGAALLVLEEAGCSHATSDGVAVGGCRILRSAEQLNRLIDLGARLSCYLSEDAHGRNDEIVSFELPIPLSQRLLALLGRMLDDERKPRNWLASTELDGAHRLTLKPLAELGMYGHHTRAD